MGIRLEFSSYGDPSVLHPVDFEPGQPGPDEVLVRNVALGVNPYDWKFVSGISGKPLEKPTVPGNEGAGVVLAIGADVTGVAVGDEVIWRTYLGGYASERLIAASKVWAKPAGIGFSEAAGVSVAGGTAWAAIHQAAAGKAG